MSVPMLIQTSSAAPTPGAPPAQTGGQSTANFADFLTLILASSGSTQPSGPATVAGGDPGAAIPVSATGAPGTVKPGTPFTGAAPAASWGTSPGSGPGQAQGAPLGSIPPPDQPPGQAPVTGSTLNPVSPLVPAALSGALPPPPAGAGQGTDPKAVPSAAGGAPGHHPGGETGQGKATQAHGRHRPAGEADPAANPQAPPSSIVLTALAQTAPAPGTGAATMPAQSNLPAPETGHQAVGAAHRQADTASARQSSPHEPAQTSSTPPAQTAPSGQSQTDASPNQHAAQTTTAETAGAHRQALESAARDVSAASAQPSVTSEAPSGTPTQVAPTRQPATTPTAELPTQQIAPAMVGLLRSADGSQSVTVNLHPAELGQVRIQIDQTQAGTAHVAITADRPETLQLLMHDQPHLQQVLDQAGVPSDGRGITFQMSPPDQVSPGASRPDSMAAGGGDLGRGQNGGAQGGGGSGQWGGGANPDQGQSQAQTRWFRAGLDIVA